MAKIAIKFSIKETPVRNNWAETQIKLKCSVGNHPIDLLVLGLVISNGASKNKNKMESVLGLRGFSNLAITAPREFFGGFFAHLHDHFIPHPRNNYHPHIFGQRLTSLFAVLLVAVKIFSVSYLSLGPALPVFSSAITTENIISLTNSQRQNFGLKALAINFVLGRAAQKKAEDMAEKSYFAHTSPDGRLPWDFIEASGYNYIMAGENLAVNFTEAESVEQAWMDSPSHKANILNKNFEEIGIGIARGQYSGKASTFVVQMFGVPVEQKIVLNSEPTQVQAQALPVPKVSEQILKQEPEAMPNVALKTDFVGKIEGLKISNLNTRIDGEQLLVSVRTSGPTTKALVVYGQKAAWMHPKAEGLWQADLALESLTQSGAKLSVEIFDIAGNVKEEQVAVFAPSAAKNFGGFEGQVAGKSLVFGRQLDLQNFQDRFYLFFLAAILTCLILAIAIKKHIQHITLVANGSFVSILAMLLWMG